MESRGALLGSTFAFLCFAAIHYPNTIIIRPHPIFWRVILALFSLYGAMMTYLFLLPLDQVQNQLKYFDQNLGKSLP
jgi:phosphatidylserine synthase 2